MISFDSIFIQFAMLFIKDRHLYFFKMKKTIYINEDSRNGLMSKLLTEALSPDREKVLIVKQYLDSNFARVETDDIDANGYPVKIKSVNMLSGNKQPLKPMQVSELLLLLDDKFNNMIKDDADRKAFLKQVITDWYNGNIDKNGILTVNFLK